MPDMMPCQACGKRYPAGFVEDLSPTTSLWTFPTRCRDCDPAAWPEPRCPRCGQADVIAAAHAAIYAETGSPIARGLSRGAVCAPCRTRDRAPQGETVPLFNPAPAGIPGQLLLEGN